MYQTSANKESLSCRRKYTSMLVAKPRGLQVGTMVFSRRLFSGYPLKTQRICEHVCHAIPRPHRTQNIRFQTEVSFLVRRSSLGGTRSGRFVFSRRPFSELSRDNNAWATQSRPTNTTEHMKFVFQTDVGFQVSNRQVCIQELHKQINRNSKKSVKQVQFQVANAAKIVTELIM